MSYGHHGVGSVESLSGQRSGSVFKSSNLALDKKGNWHGLYSVKIEKINDFI